MVGAKEYKKVSQNLMKSDDVIASRIKADTGHMDEHNNDVADTIRGKYTASYKFLQSKLPMDANGSVIDSPDPMQLAKFNRYYGASTNPLSAVENLAKGRVSAEEVEAVKTLYPSLWNQVAQQLSVAAQKTQPTAKQKQMLERWNGQSTQSTSSVQSIYGQQSNARSSKKPSVSNKDNMISTSQTSSDRLAKKFG